MTMFIALNENKNLIHITDAVRGLACNCICFECGETVLARKGNIKEHHFAHANNKDSCTIHPESVLHKYAKQKNIYAKIFLHFAAHCAIIDCIPLLCCRALPG